MFNITFKDIYLQKAYLFVIIFILVKSSFNMKLKNYYMIRLFILFIIIFVLNSCNGDKKTKKGYEKGAHERPELSQDSKIFLCNRLFSEKTCITCPAVNNKKIGPSVVDIMHVYKNIMPIS